jgi:SOS-response transcriptional repressor LexA
MSSHNLAKLALAEPKSRQDCIALAEGDEACCRALKIDQGIEVLRAEN